MKITEILLRMFVSRKCIICKNVISYDTPLPFCSECEKLWEEVKHTKCHHCGYEMDFCICIPSNLKHFPSHLVSCSVFYNSSSEKDANSIVFKLKRKGIRQVVDFMAENMIKSITEMFKYNCLDINEYIIAYVPRRKKQIKKYGFDHILLLAKSLSSKLGIKYENVFENCGNTEQKTLSKSERIENARKSYILKENADVKDKKYLLIDDVLTSGSTLRACAEILYTYGAKSVIFATYAKDNFLYGGKRNVKRDITPDFAGIVKSSMRDGTQ